MKVNINYKIICLTFFVKVIGENEKIKKIRDCYREVDKKYRLGSKY